MSIYKSSLKILLFQGTALLISFLIGIVVLEFFARVILFRKFMMWPAGMVSYFHASEDIVPGVHGRGRFSTNSMGLRGNELREEQYRILVIGGSTSESLYLDDSEAWPFLLQENLRKNGRSVWVGNAGKSGLTSRSHILQMKYLPPQIPHLNAVVILTGINDLIGRLKDDQFKPVYVEKGENVPLKFSDVFVQWPVGTQYSGDYPWFKQTVLWDLGRKIKNALLKETGQLKTQDSNGDWYNDKRRRRMEATHFRESLPDVRPALEEYRENLNLLIDLAKAKGTRIILMTQPVLWRQYLPQTLEKLLWYGWIGEYNDDTRSEYYSTPVLKEGMDLYNQTLLGVCKQRQIECIDLTPKLSGDPRYFYDDCHFTEEGARKLAEIVAEHFLIKP